MGLSTSTAITLAGVFPVWDEGVQETISTDGGVVRTVLCRWEDRITLYNNLGASAASIGGVDTGNPVGLAYPPMPWFFVSQIEMNSVDGEGGKITDSFGVVGSKYARLQITYRKSILPSIGGGNPQYTLDLDFGHEIIAVKAGGFTMNAYSSAQLPDDHYVTIRVPLVSIKVTAVGQATFPIAKVLAAADAPLNSVAFLGAPANQILFDGEKTRAIITANGLQNWDESIHFLYRGKPWNQIYYGGDATHAPGWTALTPDPYAGQTSDLNALLP